MMIAQPFGKAFKVWPNCASVLQTNVALLLWVPVNPKKGQVVKRGPFTLSDAMTEARQKDWWQYAKAIQVPVAKLTGATSGWLAVAIMRDKHQEHIASMVKLLTSQSGGELQVFKSCPLTWYKRDKCIHHAHIAPEHIFNRPEEYKFYIQFV